VTAASPTPGQRPFARVGDGKHSLARLETAMWWLEIDEAEVFDLIADHALVAFNLARPGVERRLPGIWSRSLLEYPSLPCRAATSHYAPQTYPSAQTPSVLAAPKRLPSGGLVAPKLASASEVGMAQQHSTAEVLIDLFPPSGRDLRFAEVLFALGIKRRLLHVLLEASLLTAVPGTGDKVSKAPTITRASLVDFLTTRRM
jgi:hypothetical protein